MVIATLILLYLAFQRILLITKSLMVPTKAPAYRRTMDTERVDWCNHTKICFKRFFQSTDHRIYLAMVKMCLRAKFIFCNGCNWPCTMFLGKVLLLHKVLLYATAGDFFSDLTIPQSNYLVTNNLFPLFLSFTTLLLRYFKHASKIIPSVARYKMHCQYLFKTVIHVCLIHI